MGSEAAAALAKLRWSKATDEERREVGRMLNEARWGRRKAGKAKSKPAKENRSKSK